MIETTTISSVIKQEGKSEVGYRPYSEGKSAGIDKGAAAWIASTNGSTEAEINIDRSGDKKDDVNVTNVGKGLYEGW